MIEIVSKLMQIYLSPLLLFTGRFEFANFYNLMLVTVFTVAVVWFTRRARIISEGTERGLATFTGVTKENLAEKFDDIHDTMRQSWLASAWERFSATLIVTKSGASSDNTQRHIYTTNDASDFFGPDRLICMNRSFFNALPSVFTGLGLLGTFFGLIFGLQGIDFGNPTLMRQSMAQLLGGMFVAFSSSVWGITLSIAFTTLEKWRINDLETKIHALHDAINSVFSLTTQEVFLNDLLGESREQSRALKSFSTDLADAVKRGMGEAVHTELASAMNRVAEAVERLQEFKQQTAVEAVGQLVEKFNTQLMTHTQTQFDRLTGALSEMSDVVILTSEEFQTQMEKMGSASLQAVQGLHQETAAWLEQLKTQFSEIVHQRTVELNEMSSVMRDAQSVAVMSSEAVQQISAAAALIAPLTQDLQGAAAQLGQMASELRQAQEAYSFSAAELMENSERQYALTRGIVEEMQHMPDAMKSMWEGYTQQLTQTQKDVEVIFNKLTTGLHDYQETVDKGLQGYFKLTRTALNDYLGQVDSQLARSAEVLGNAIASLSDGVDEIHEAISRISHNGNGSRSHAVTV